MNQKICACCNTSTRFLHDVAYTINYNLIQRFFFSSYFFLSENIFISFFLRSTVVAQSKLYILSSTLKQRKKDAEHRNTQQINELNVNIMDVAKPDNKTTF